MAAALSGLSYVAQMEFPLNFYSKKVILSRRGQACLCKKATGNEVVSRFSCGVCQCCSKKDVGKGGRQESCCSATRLALSLLPQHLDCHYLKAFYCKAVTLDQCSGCHKQSITNAIHFGEWGIHTRGTRSCVETTLEFLIKYVIFSGLILLVNRALSMYFLPFKISRMFSDFHRNMFLLQHNLPLTTCAIAKLWLYCSVL